MSLPLPTLKELQKLSALKGKGVILERRAWSSCRPRRLGVAFMPCAFYYVQASRVDVGKRTITSFSTTTRAWPT